MPNHTHTDYFDPFATHELYIKRKQPKIEDVYDKLFKAVDKPKPKLSVRYYGGPATHAITATEIGMMHQNYIAQQAPPPMSAQQQQFMNQLTAMFTGPLTQGLTSTESET
jgi:hypothetical protein